MENANLISKNKHKRLGHAIDDDAGIASCFSKTVAAMWRSFFRNRSQPLLTAEAATKIRFLKQCVATILRFRCARWPFQEHFAGQLDRAQRQMLYSLFLVRLRAEETWDSFQRRRRIFAGRQCRAVGLWSDIWARSLLDWKAHIDRANDSGVWAKHCVAHRNSDWLLWTRAVESGSGRTQRLNSRAHHGKVQRRWEESVTCARAHSSHE